MQNVKKSLICNYIIFTLVLLGTIFMVTGYQFMTNTTVLDSSGFNAFKFYTVDSNILVGIASFIMMIYEMLLINKKIKEIPKYVYLLKYIGTVGVILTFLVTALYLVPVYRENCMFLYMNTNFFFHLIVPILSVLSYVKYEKNKLEYKYSFVTLSSVILYSIYYVSNILLHLENGQIVKEYDWYSFLLGGLNSMAFVMIFILIISFSIAHVIFKLNKRVKK